jgi:hypothetical protein
MDSQISQSQKYLLNVHDVARTLEHSNSYAPFRVTIRRTLRSIQQRRGSLREKEWVCIELALVRLRLPSQLGRKLPN